MKHVVTNLPVAVDVVEHCFVPLKDGTRLAARMWLPKDCEVVKYPAILEYIPYRKRDGTRARDEPMHGFFAGNGYAAIRVDMRGSGDSDGLLRDEYLLQEQEDALEVIEWIANQSWCTGSVGMMGKSWGGFNSLQVASRRPPALKAIIVLGFTDNRFTDDIHYKGGCLLNDNFWWGAIMQAYMSRPPDPVCVGEDKWRSMWLKRLEEMPFNAADWASHQKFDDYWKHGSVCTDYSAIQCAVLAVDGWADAYTNTLFRLLRHLKVPRKGIVGPWAHLYPQDGSPTPPMNFLRAAVNWWDYWLKDKKDNGAMHGDMLQVYVEDGLPPSASKPHAPGRWISLPSWPAPDCVEELSLHIGRYKQLQEKSRGSDGGSGAEDVITVHTPLNHGLLSGEWMGAGVLGETASDQRLDNGMSVNFELVNSDAAHEISIVGRPSFTAEVSCNATKGFLFAQLCDVAPDGASTRITYGMQNLVHTGGIGRFEEVHPMVTHPAGATSTFRTVRVKMDYCAYRVPKGHIIRLCLANNFWPMVWPSPQDTTLTIKAATALLKVPILKNGGGGLVVPGPDPNVEVAALTPMTTVSDGHVGRSVTYDIVDDTWTCVTDGVGGVFGEGVYRFDEIDTTVEHNLRRELVLSNKDPLSAKYTLTQLMRLSRPGWNTEMHIVCTKTSDAENIYMESSISASCEGQQVFEKTWRRTISREAI